MSKAMESNNDWKSGLRRRLSELTGPTNDEWDSTTTQKDQPSEGRNEERPKKRHLFRRKKTQKEKKSIKDAKGMPQKSNGGEEEEEEDEEDEEGRLTLDSTDEIMAVPKLPKGKKLLDTLVGSDVDSLYKSVFENDNFFEIVGSKAYEEFRNFQCSPWSQNRTSGLPERTMKYQISKNIAFSRQNVSVEQTQINLGYSRRGFLYGIDTVTKNSGVVYSDYFILNIHYRLMAESAEQSRFVVIADIEFLKPCLFKGRIESEAWSGMKKYYDIVDKEVQLEKDLISSSDAVDSSPLRNIKDIQQRVRQRRHHSGSVSKTDHFIPSASEDLNNPPVSSEFLLLVFFIIVFTLVLITLAMFKMNSAVSSLDERLERIEKILERNGKIFQVITEEYRS